MKEFFEVFGIEPKCQSQDKCGCKYCSNYDYTCKLNRTREKCDYLNKFGWAFNYYPPITPEIVLKLITILVKKHCNITLYWGLPKLTEQILKQCIRDKNDKEIQDQVRALFND